MELPDFDTLKYWALAEPERLDALLHQQIETLIAQVGPERQRRSWRDHHSGGLAIRNCDDKA